MGSEGFKGGAHAVTGSLAAALCLYNAMAYGQTGQRRNAVNVVLYGLLWAYEGVQTHYHWSQREP
jgi:hypothetical protein